MKLNIRHLTISKFFLLGFVFELLEIVLDSGWRGPVGILGHNVSVDFRQRLKANIDGLSLILQEIESNSLGMIGIQTNREKVKSRQRSISALSLC